MPSVSVSKVASFVQRLAGPNSVVSDAALLTRFVKARDEAAFATLVERYGPLVRGACCRTLGDVAAVDDVVQTTFIALARKAGTIRGKSLPAWLHAAAQRQSLHHRSREFGRLGRERRAAKPEAHVTEQAWHQLHAILDEEVGKLPDSLRAPILLCYFDSRTQDEAARQLGFSAPTLRRRLEKGRTLLRLRLERRGVAPALVLTAVAMNRKSISAATAREIAARVLSAPAELHAAAQAATAIGGGLRAYGRMFVGVALVAGALASGIGLTDPTASPAPAAAQHEDPRPESRLDADGQPLPEGALARVGSTRFRHGGMLGAMAISRDGKTLASIGRPGGIAVWDAETGMLKHRIEAAGGDRFTVSSIRFLNDGSIVALNDLACFIVTPDGNVHFVVHSATNPVGQERASGATVSPDGKRFAVGRWNKNVHVYDALTGAEIWHAAVEAVAIESLAFSPDGKTLAVATMTPTVCLFDAMNGKPTGELITDQPKISGVEFSPDGKWLSANSSMFEKTMSVWDVAARTVRWRNKDLDYHLSQSVAFAPDGKLLAASSVDRKVRLIDATDGKIVRTFSNPSMPYRLMFSPDGNTLACANSAGFISEMDIETGEIKKAADPFGGVYTARFTPDGTKLALASDRFSIRNWKTGEIVSRFEPLGDRDLGWDISSDCKLAAYSDPEFALHVSEIETGKERFKLAPSKSSLNSKFSPDGRRLFKADIDGLIEVIDVSTGYPLNRLDGKLRNNLVFNMAASPDGRWLAAASTGTVGQRDDAIRVWDLKSGGEFRRITPKVGPISELTFSPDSKMLAAVGGVHDPENSSGSVELWNPESSEPIRQFEGHKQYVLSVAFSPDGRTLVTGSRDGTVRLWEVATGVERRRIDGHAFYVRSVAFSPDGSKLVTTSYDAPVYVWDVYSPPGQPSKPSVNEICDALSTSSAHLGAIGLMIENPEVAIDACKARIKPIATPDEKKVKQHVADLASANFRIRDQAEGDLSKLGDVIEPMLRRELAASQSAETTARLKRLLSQFASPSGERLAALRAMEAVEHINNAQAQKLMQDWANGDADSSFTRAAKKSLERMKAR